MPNIEVKEGDLIVKLCEKVHKLTVLELKIDYLFNCLQKKEEDFDCYVEAKFNLHKNIKNFESKIITLDDFILPSMGIKKNLNKKIKEVKLLYRATRDGDNAQFHNKCNGKNNTLTFVKAIEMEENLEVFQIWDGIQIIHGLSIKILFFFL